MKNFIAVTVIIGSLFVGQSLQQTDEHVNFALYYEPLCPGSGAFLEDGLIFNYRNVSSFVNVALNPYGNAHRKLVNGHWQFKCQHGEEECKLAKLSVCGFQYLDTWSQIRLANCLDDINFAEKCIKKVHLNYTEIVSCATGELGEKLFAKYGEETDALQPPHHFVPYMTFNGVYNATLEHDARNDFIEATCSLLKKTPKPHVCQHYRRDDKLYVSYKENEENQNFL